MTCFFKISKVVVRNIKNINGGLCHMVSMSNIPGLDSISYSCISSKSGNDTCSNSCSNNNSNSNCAIKRRRVSPRMRQVIWESFYGEELARKPCPVCGYMIHYNDCVIGHITSLARGGSDSISNKIPLCASCNNSMGTENVYEYARKYFAGRSMLK